MCLRFLTTKEKDAALGAFVKSAFKHYSKSKEKLDSHESADYHKKAEERGLYAKTQLQNIANRIDIQLNKVTNQNIKVIRQYCPISPTLLAYAQCSRFLLEDTEMTKYSTVYARTYRQ